MPLSMKRVRIISGKSGRMCWDMLRHATIADAPQLVLTTPDRVSAPRGKSVKIKVVVARMDDGAEPLEIAAKPSAGIVVEPASVAPGATQADVQIINSGERLRI